MCSRHVTALFFSQGEFQSYLEIHMPVHFALFLVSSGPLEPISAECKNFYPVAFYNEEERVLEGQVSRYWPKFTPPPKKKATK